MKYKVSEYRAFGWKSTAGVNETSSTEQENHENSIVEAENATAALLSALGCETLPKYLDSHHGYIRTAEHSAGFEDRESECGIQVTLATIADEEDYL